MTHHRIKLADHRERKEREGAIDIELADGSVVTMPPPELIPDELLTKLQKDEITEVEFVEQLVGAEAYARVVAEGGTATMLGSLFEQFHGESLGK